MPRKLIVTFAVFLILGGLIFMTAWAGNQQSVALPQRITAETPCPVAGCVQSDGACHAASDPPLPDGSSNLKCPRINGCSDTQCHAWERIESSHSQPSDASLNLWIMAPVVLVIGLVYFIRKF